ncbi:hypothetical protein [Trichormus sp. NMC-1]|uniref:hypothetical protein n=1 Tax=Trichormus sp. NMC-1 TaxID=1853259 RepID=UPI0008DC0B06|nr:hypothetical protein [Trichormus sp. NMC-1]
MTTVIFIHGISVREPVLSQTFTQIKGKLLEGLPNLTVVSCAWGDSLGARLNADGASIPLYDSTQNDNQATQPDENIIRWTQLYQDPLYELRLLSLKTPEKQGFTPRQEKPSEKLDNKVQNFQPSDNLQAELQKCGIADIFADACKNVVKSLAYKDGLKTISDNTLTEYRDAIARAIIATSITICEENKIVAPILTDSTLRDDVIKSLSYEIIDSERGIGDWLQEQILKFAQSPLATYYLKRNRGFISDATYPIVGDVLLYQGRGQKIRDLIYKYIEKAEPPVVLLAHSLGGIACVDLLVEQLLNEEKVIKKVKLLITVGSQAPYFYEVNALQSLEFNSDRDKRLPQSFPEWLNIYDLQDFLSYIGSNIFPGVQDIQVDNKQPFPQSHSAYWNNKATWKYILPRIQGL